MQLHEPTVVHLRERVRGPVVLWLVDRASVPSALVVQHLLTTFHRSDAQAIVVETEPLPWPERRVLQRFVEELALTSVWLVADLVPGQVEAFEDRAVVVLRRIPDAGLDMIAAALAELIGIREDSCASA